MNKKGVIYCPNIGEHLTFNNDKTKKKKQIENIKKNIWKKLLSCNLSNLTTSEYEVIWSDNKDLEREILEKIEDI